MAIEFNLRSPENTPGAVRAEHEFRLDPHRDHWEVSVSTRAVGEDDAERLTGKDLTDINGLSEFRFLREQVEARGFLFPIGMPAAIDRVRPALINAARIGNPDGHALAHISAAIETWIKESTEIQSGALAEIDTYLGHLSKAHS